MTSATQGSQVQGILSGTSAKSNTSLWALMQLLAVVGTTSEERQMDLLRSPRALHGHVSFKDVTGNTLGISHIQSTVPSACCPFSTQKPDPESINSPKRYPQAKVQCLLHKTPRHNWVIASCATLLASPFGY